MPLIVLRITFLIVATGVGLWIISPESQTLSDLFQDPVKAYPGVVFVSVILIALTAIGLDVAARRKRLDLISAVYFGLIVGLFLAFVARLAMTPLPIEPRLRDSLQLVLATVLCYLCISVLLQTKDDFRFIIPYVEFSKDVKGLKPCILDTSVVIDGRIADVVETGALDGPLIMPRFVLTELQSIADSSDRAKRSRGRRGLDILNRLRGDKNVDLEIYERELPELDGQPVDMKLVLLAKHLGGRVVTNDYNLNKVARLHEVGVINLNDIANALKPVFLPGEQLEVRIVKAGEEPGQGVGYLDDGTMVVVEQGRDHVHSTVKVAVTSVLQTSAGRMIFGKYEASGAPA